MFDIPAGRWEGLDGMGDELLREIRGEAEGNVLAAVVYFASEIKVTLSGPRTGRTYRVSRTGALHVASAPGEPPAVLSGNLRNSIGHSTPTWEGQTVSAEVGPGLGQPPAGGLPDPATTYARRLEWGGVDRRGIRMLPRPYMEPTAIRVAPVLERMLER
jgi:hypothetical protein